MGKILDYQPAIEAYQSGLSMTQACLLCGVDRHTLAKRLTALGIPIRSIQTYTTLSLNHAAFDEATDEAAYWVGMLMADGCIYQRNIRCAPEIRLDISDQDRTHLERFKAFLGAGQAIRVRPVVAKSGRSYDYCVLVVHSHQIANKLAEYGVTPQKTERERVMGLERNRHFWRGVMDGDGCLTWTAKYPAIQLVGGQPLMQQFCDYIAHAVDVHTTPRQFKPSVWTVCVYGRKAVAITNHLYTPGDVALERKRARAQAFASHYK